MKTIICDIDGTLTDMRPLEEAVIRQMPKNIKNTTEYYKEYNEAFLKISKDNIAVKKFPLVDWIFKNKDKYAFVYATGGQRLESEYVLDRLGILKFFDIENSVSKSDCRFSKSTGIPFRRIKKKYQDLLVITDTQADCLGAEKVGIQSVFVDFKF